MLIQKKKRYLFSVLLFLFLCISTAAGFILLKSNQDTRQQASGTCPVSNPYCNGLLPAVTTAPSSNLNTQGIISTTYTGTRPSSQSGCGGGMWMNSFCYMPGDELAGGKIILASGRYDYPYIEDKKVYESTSFGAENVSKVVGSTENLGKDCNGQGVALGNTCYAYGATVNGYLVVPPRATGCTNTAGDYCYAHLEKIEVPYKDWQTAVDLYKTNGDVKALEDLYQKTYGVSFTAGSLYDPNAANAGLLKAQAILSALTNASVLQQQAAAENAALTSKGSLNSNEQAIFDFNKQIINDPNLANRYQVLDQLNDSTSQQTTLNAAVNKMYSTLVVAGSDSDLNRIATEQFKAIFGYDPSTKYGNVNGILGAFGIDPAQLNADRAKYAAPVVQPSQAAGQTTDQTPAQTTKQTEDFNKLNTEYQNYVNGSSTDINGLKSAAITAGVITADQLKNLSEAQVLALLLSKFSGTSTTQAQQEAATIVAARTTAAEEKNLTSQYIDNQGKAASYDDLSNLYTLYTGKTLEGSVTEEWLKKEIAKYNSQVALSLYANTQDVSYLKNYYSNSDSANSYGTWVPDDPKLLLSSIYGSEAGNELYGQIVLPNRFNEAVSNFAIDGGRSLTSVCKELNVPDCNIDSKNATDKISLMLDQIYQGDPKVNVPDLAVNYSNQIYAENKTQETQSFWDLAFANFAMAQTADSASAIIFLGEDSAVAQNFSATLDNQQQAMDSYSTAVEASKIFNASQTFSYATENRGALSDYTWGMSYGNALMADNIINREFTPEEMGLNFGQTAGLTFNQLSSQVAGVDVAQNIATNYATSKKRKKILLKYLDYTGPADTGISNIALTGASNMGVLDYSYQPATSGYYTAKTFKNWGEDIGAVMTQAGAMYAAGQMNQAAINQSMYTDNQDITLIDPVDYANKANEEFKADYSENMKNDLYSNYIANANKAGINQVDQATYEQFLTDPEIQRSSQQLDFERLSKVVAPVVAAPVLTAMLISGVGAPAVLGIASSAFSLYQGAGMKAQALEIQRIDIESRENAVVQSYIENGADEVTIEKVKTDLSAQVDALNQQGNMMLANSAVAAMTSVGGLLTSAAGAVNAGATANVLATSGQVLTKAGQVSGIAMNSYNAVNSGISSYNSFQEGNIGGGIMSGISSFVAASGVAGNTFGLLGPTSYTNKIDYVLDAMNVPAGAAVDAQQVAQACYGSSGAFSEKDCTNAWIGLALSAGQNVSQIASSRKSYLADTAAAKAGIETAHVVDIQKQIDAIDAEVLALNGPNKGMREGLQINDLQAQRSNLVAQAEGINPNFRIAGNDNSTENYMASSVRVASDLETQLKDSAEAGKAAEAKYAADVEAARIAGKAEVANYLDQAEVARKTAQTEKEAYLAGQIEIFKEGPNAIAAVRDQITAIDEQITKRGVLLPESEVADLQQKRTALVADLENLTKSLSAVDSLKTQNEALLSVAKKNEAFSEYENLLKNDVEKASLVKQYAPDNEQVTKYQTDLEANATKVKLETDETKRLASIAALQDSLAKVTALESQKQALLIGLGVDSSDQVGRKIDGLSAEINRLNNQGVLNEADTARVVDLETQRNDLQVEMVKFDAIDAEIGGIRQIADAVSADSRPIWKKITDFFSPGKSTREAYYKSLDLTREAETLRAKLAGVGADSADAKAFREQLADANRQLRDQQYLLAQAAANPSKGMRQTITDFVSGIKTRGQIADLKDAAKKMGESNLNIAEAIVAKQAEIERLKTEDATANQVEITRLEGEVTELLKTARNPLKGNGAVIAVDKSGDFTKYVVTDAGLAAGIKQKQLDILNTELQAFETFRRSSETQADVKKNGGPFKIYSGTDTFKDQDVFLLAEVEAFGAGRRGTVFGALPGMGKTDVVMPFNILLKQRLTGQPQFVVFPEAKLAKPWTTGGENPIPNKAFIDYVESQFGKGSVVIIKANDTSVDPIAIANAKFVITTKDVAFDLQNTDTKLGLNLRSKWRNSFVHADEVDWTFNPNENYKLSGTQIALRDKAEFGLYADAQKQVLGIDENGNLLPGRGLNTLNDLISKLSNSKSVPEGIARTSDGKGGKFASPELEKQVLGEWLGTWGGQSKIPGLDMSADTKTIRQQINDYLTRGTDADVHQRRAEMAMINETVNFLSRVPGEDYGPTSNKKTVGGVEEVVSSIAPREQGRTSGRSYSAVAESLLYNSLGARIMGANGQVDINKITVGEGGSEINYALLMLESRGFSLYTGTPETVAKLYKMAYGIELNVFTDSAVDSSIARFNAPPAGTNSRVFTNLQDQMTARLADGRNQVFINMASGLRSNEAALANLVKTITDTGAPYQKILLVGANGELIEYQISGGALLRTGEFASTEAMNARTADLDKTSERYVKFYEYGAHVGVDTANNVSLSRAIGLCNGCDQTTFSQGINRVRVQVTKNSTGAYEVKHAPIDIVWLDAPSVLRDPSIENFTADMSRLQTINEALAEVSFKETLLKNSVDGTFAELIDLARNGKDGFLGFGSYKTNLDIVSQLEAAQQKWKETTGMNYMLGSDDMTAQAKLEKTASQVGAAYAELTRLLANSGEPAKLLAKRADGAIGNNPVKLAFSGDEGYQVLGENPSYRQIVDLINQSSKHLESVNIAFTNKSSAPEVVGNEMARAASEAQINSKTSTDGNIDGGAAPVRPGSDGPDANGGGAGLVRPAGDTTTNNGTNNTRNTTTNNNSSNQSSQNNSSRNIGFATFASNLWNGAVDEEKLLAENAAAVEDNKTAIAAGYQAQIEKLIEQLGAATEPAEKDAIDQQIKNLKAAQADQTAIDAAAKAKTTEQLADNYRTDGIKSFFVNSERGGTFTVSAASLANLPVAWSDSFNEQAFMTDNKAEIDNTALQIKADALLEKAAEMQAVADEINKLNQELQKTKANKKQQELLAAMEALAKQVDVIQAENESINQKDFTAEAIPVVKEKYADDVKYVQIGLSTHLSNLRSGVSRLLASIPERAGGLNVSADRALKAWNEAKALLENKKENLAPVADAGTQSVPEIQNNKTSSVSLSERIKQLSDRAKQLWQKTAGFRQAVSSLASKLKTVPTNRIAILSPEEKTQLDTLAKDYGDINAEVKYLNSQISDAKAILKDLEQKIKLSGEINQELENIKNNTTQLQAKLKELQGQRDEFLIRSKEISNQATALSGQIKPAFTKEQQAAAAQKIRDKVVVELDKNINQSLRTLALSLSRENNKDLAAVRMQITQTIKGEFARYKLQPALSYVVGEFSYLPEFKNDPEGADGYIRDILGTVTEDFFVARHTATNRLQISLQEDEVTRRDIITIGDVHGDWKALVGLLSGSSTNESGERISKPLLDSNEKWIGGPTDYLVLTGDLFDRAPAGVSAAETAERIMNLQKQAGNFADGTPRVKVLIGNHDINAIFAYWRMKDILANRPNVDKNTAAEAGSFTGMNPGITPEEVIYLFDHPDLANWVMNLDAMTIDDGVLRFHSDTTAYTAYGKTVQDVNNRIRSIMSNQSGLKDLELLLHDLTKREGFDLAGDVSYFLETYNAEHLVHGHSETAVPKDSRVTNVDGALSGSYDSKYGKGKSRGRTFTQTVPGIEKLNVAIAAGLPKQQLGVILARPLSDVLIEANEQSESSRQKLSQLRSEFENISAQLGQINKQIEKNNLDTDAAANSGSKLQDQLSVLNVANLLSAQANTNQTITGLEDGLLQSTALLQKAKALLDAQREVSNFLNSFRQAGIQVKPFLLGNEALSDVSVLSQKLLDLVLEAFNQHKFTRNAFILNISKITPNFVSLNGLLSIADRTIDLSAKIQAALDDASKLLEETNRKKELIGKINPIMEELKAKGAILEYDLAAMTADELEKALVDLQQMNESYVNENDQINNSPEDGIALSALRDKAVQIGAESSLVNSWKTEIDANQWLNDQQRKFTKISELFKSLGIDVNIVTVGDYEKQLDILSNLIIEIDALEKSSGLDYVFFQGSTEDILGMIIINQDSASFKDVNDFKSKASNAVKSNTKLIDFVKKYDPVFSKLRQPGMIGSLSLREINEALRTVDRATKFFQNSKLENKKWWTEIKDFAKQLTDVKANLTSLRSELKQLAQSYLTTTKKKFNYNLDAGEISLREQIQQIKSLINTDETSSSNQGVDYNLFLVAQNNLALKNLTKQQILDLAKATNLPLNTYSETKLYEDIYGILLDSSYRKDIVQIIAGVEEVVPGSDLDPRVSVEINQQSGSSMEQSIYEAVANSIDAIPGIGNSIGKFGKGIKQILAWLDTNGQDNVEVLTTSAGSESVLYLRVSKNESGYNISLKKLSKDDAKRDFAFDLDHGTKIKLSVKDDIAKLNSELNDVKTISQEKIVGGVRNKYSFVPGLKIFTSFGGDDYKLINGYNKKRSIIPYSKGGIVNDPKDNVVYVKANSNSIEIIDNGTGMNEALLSRMFVPKQGSKVTEPLNEQQIEQEKTKLGLIFEELGNDEEKRIIFSRNREGIVSFVLPSNKVEGSLVSGNLLLELANLVEVPESRDSLIINSKSESGKMSNFEVAIDDMVDRIVSNSELQSLEKIKYINTIIAGIEFLEGGNPSYKKTINSIKGATKDKIKDILVSLRKDGYLIFTDEASFSSIAIDRNKTVFLNKDVFDWNESYYLKNYLGAKIVSNITVGGASKLPLVFVDFDDNATSLARAFNGAWHLNTAIDRLPVIKNGSMVVLPKNVYAFARFIELNDLRSQRELNTEEQQEFLDLAERIDIITADQVVTDYEIGSVEQNLRIEDVEIITKDELNVKVDEGNIDSDIVNKFLANDFSSSFVNPSTNTNYKKTLQPFTGAPTGEILVDQNGGVLDVKSGALILESGAEAGVYSYNSRGSNYYTKTAYDQNEFSTLQFSNEYTLLLKEEIEFTSSSFLKSKQKNAIIIENGKKHFYSFYLNKTIGYGGYSIGFDDIVSGPNGLFYFGIINGQIVEVFFPQMIDDPRFLTSEFDTFKENLIESLNKNDFKVWFTINDPPGPYSIDKFRGAEIRLDFPKGRALFDAGGNFVFTADPTAFIAPTLNESNLKDQGFIEIENDKLSSYIYRTVTNENQKKDIQMINFSKSASLSHLDDAYGVPRIISYGTAGVNITLNYGGKVTSRIVSKATMDPEGRFLFVGESPNMEIFDLRNGYSELVSIDPKFTKGDITVVSDGDAIVIKSNIYGTNQTSFVLLKDKNNKQVVITFHGEINQTQLGRIIDDLKSGADTKESLETKGLTEFNQINGVNKADILNKIIGENQENRDRYIQEFRNIYMPILNSVPEEHRQEFISSIKQMYVEQEEYLKSQVLSYATNGSEIDLSNGPIDMAIKNANKIPNMQAFLEDFNKRYGSLEPYDKSYAYQHLSLSLFSFMKADHTILDIKTSDLSLSAYITPFLRQKSIDMNRACRPLIEALENEGYGYTQILHISAFFDEIAGREWSDPKIVSQQIAKIMALRSGERKKFFDLIVGSFKSNIRLLDIYLRRYSKEDIDNIPADLRSIFIFLSRDVDQLRLDDREQATGRDINLPEEGLQVSQIIKMNQAKGSLSQPVNNLEELVTGFATNVPKIDENLESEVLKNIAVQREGDAHTAEITQNAKDATRGRAGKLVVDFYLRVRNGIREYVEEAYDNGTGALDEIALLIPKSTKSIGQQIDLAGFFGTGKYTIFEGVDKVEIVSVNEDRAYQFFFEVKKNDAGNPEKLVLVGFKDLAGENLPTGVTVRRIKYAENTIPEFEAISSRQSWKMFAGMSQNDNFKIYIKAADGKEEELIVEGKKLLADVDLNLFDKDTKTVVNKGKIQIYETKDMPLQIIDRNGLRVKEIKDEYLKLIPKDLRKYVSDLHLNIQIPLPLIRNRGSFENESYYLPQIQKYLAIAFFKALAQKAITQTNPQFVFTSLPLDWYSSPNYSYAFDLGKDVELIGIIKKINDGKIDELSTEELQSLINQEEMDWKNGILKLILNLNVTTDDSKKTTSMLLKRLQVQAEIAKKSNELGTKSRVSKEMEMAKELGIEVEQVSEQPLSEVDTARVAQAASMVNAYVGMDSFFKDPEKYVAKDLTASEEFARKKILEIAKTFGIEEVAFVEGVDGFAGAFSGYDNSNASSTKKTFYLQRSLAGNYTRVSVHELAHYLEKLVSNPEFDGVTNQFYVPDAGVFTHSSVGTFAEAMKYVSAKSLLNYDPTSLGSRLFEFKLALQRINGVDSLLVQSLIKSINLLDVNKLNDAITYLESLFQGQSLNTAPANLLDEAGSYLNSLCSDCDLVREQTKAGVELADSLLAEADVFSKQAVAARTAGNQKQAVDFDKQAAAKKQAAIKQLDDIRSQVIYDHGWENQCVQLYLNAWVGAREALIRQTLADTNSAIKSVYEATQFIRQTLADGFMITKAVGLPGLTTPVQNIPLDAQAKTDFEEMTQKLKKWAEFKEDAGNLTEELVAGELKTLKDVQLQKSSQEYIGDSLRIGIREIVRQMRTNFISDKQQEQLELALTEIQPVIAAFEVEGSIGSVSLSELNRNLARVVDGLDYLMTSDFNQDNILEKINAFADTLQKRSDYMSKLRTNAETLISEYITLTGQPYTFDSSSASAAKLIMQADKLTSLIEAKKQEISGVAPVAIAPVADKKEFKPAETLKSLGNGLNNFRKSLGRNAAAAAVGFGTFGTGLYLWAKKAAAKRFASKINLPKLNIRKPRNIVAAVLSAMVVASIVYFSVVPQGTKVNPVDNKPAIVQTVEAPQAQAPVEQAPVVEAPAVVAQPPVVEKAPTVVAPPAVNAIPTQQSSLSDQEIKAIEQEITGILEEAPGEWGAYIHKIGSTEAGYSYQENKSFHAASTIKVPVAMAVMRYFESQNISLEQALQIAPKGQDRIIAQLMKAMLIQSEEEATSILVDFVNASTQKDMSAYFEEIGINGILYYTEDVDGYARSASAESMAIILENLYANKSGLSKTSTDYILNLMKTYSKDDDFRIGAGLTAEIKAKMAHKTGTVLEDDIFTASDVAIVTLPNGDAYTIVIYNALDNKTQYNVTPGIITEISKLAFKIYSPTVVSQSDSQGDISTVSKVNGSLSTAAPDSLTASFFNSSKTNKVLDAENIPELTFVNSNNQKVGFYFAEYSQSINSKDLSAYQSAFEKVAPFYSYLQTDQIRLEKMEPGTIDGGESYYGISGSEILSNGQWLGSIKFTSDYETKSHLQKILSNIGLSDKASIAALIHEIGHIIKYEKDANGNYVKSRLLTSFDNNFYGSTKGSTELPPTDYAKAYYSYKDAGGDQHDRAVTEDLADVIALYSVAPEYLKQVAPLRYEFIDAIAHGTNPGSFQGEMSNADSLAFNDLCSDCAQVREATKNGVQISDNLMAEANALNEQALIAETAGDQTKAADLAKQAEAKKKAAIKQLGDTRNQVVNAHGMQNQCVQLYLNAWINTREAMIRKTRADVDSAIDSVYRATILAEEMLNSKKMSIREGGIFGFGSTVKYKDLTSDEVEDVADLLFGNVSKDIEGLQSWAFFKEGKDGKFERIIISGSLLELQNTVISSGISSIRVFLRDFAISTRQRIFFDELVEKISSLTKDSKKIEEKVDVSPSVSPSVSVAIDPSVSPSPSVSLSPSAVTPSPSVAPSTENDDLISGFWKKILLGIGGLSIGLGVFLTIYSQTINAQLETVSNQTSPTQIVETISPTLTASPSPSPSPSVSLSPSPSPSPSVSLSPSPSPSPTSIAAQPPVEVKTVILNTALPDEYVVEDPYAKYKYMPDGTLMLIDRDEWNPIDTSIFPEYATNRNVNDYLKTLQLFNVDESLRYRRASDTTFCNIYVSDVTSALGVYIPRWKNGEKMTATTTLEWLEEPLAQDLGWQSTSALKAQEMANQGIPTIAITRGHIAMVAPGTGQTNEQSGVFYPSSAQAGRLNFDSESPIEDNSVEIGFAGAISNGQEIEYFYNSSQYELVQPVENQ
jgi:hypothetical protein